MWREILVAVILYAFVISAHMLHKAWDRRRERKAREAAEAQALNALSPLHRPLEPTHLTHGIAFATACVGPSCIEAAKHYIVHLLIYSGYILPH